MNVLVTYASRHGSTAGIAERIVSQLRAAGLPTDVMPVDEVTDLHAYDAFVIGGAAYMGHWMKDVTAFVKHHRALLADDPVWLFSSGPLGADNVDKDGRDVLESARPKEFEDIVAAIRPRAAQVFFGAWDPSTPPAGIAEQLMKLVPAGKQALPSGDFRDWTAIDAWADEIATVLSGLAAVFRSAS